MSMLQLTPSIPVYCDDLGKGQAIALIDYSEESYLYFVVALENGGDIWVLDNRHVKLQKNISIGRTLEKETKE